MPLSDLPQSTLGALRSAGAYLADLATPTVRLGVTGFARAGKTVFITSLVRNLLVPGRLPFFAPQAEGRLVRAWLEPQPDDDVPRFAYEEHLAALASDPPVWPESTRRISQLRITLEFTARSAVKRTFASNRLNLDIVDYPGEWLVDLALMGQSFADWSANVLTAARDPRRSRHAAELEAFLAALPDGGEGDEQTAIAGAEVFRRYLAAARAEAGAAGAADPTLGPGRFLLPGELDGSPLLTFFPLRPAGETPARGPLAGLLARRFESYKTRCVRPFFRDHFARLDRQIVLVDVLAALDQGGPAIRDLETALSNVLSAFRPGAQSWLSLVLPRRIDRVLIAATKADHLHHSSHDRLEAVLAEITRRASARAAGAGAEVKALALAALRSTREAELARGGERLACIVGTPLPGERIGPDTFDGIRTAAIFPGDIPADAAAVLAGGAVRSVGPEVAFVRFRPARVAPDGPDGSRAPWPHIRLDRALDYLIGDRLA